MKLSVVIVNYNVKHFLEQCLYSLTFALDGVEAEVYVVDNASTDGSEVYIKQRYPSVHYIYNRDNVGFSCANNQAIRLSEAEYVLLLNPDTLVAESTIKQCLTHLDEHPSVGAVGVKMITGNGVFLPESKRGFPSPQTSFYKFAGLSRLFPHSPRFGSYHLGYLSPDEIHRIDVMSGAYMLLRRSALERSGLLDEDFFMYGEDIDLSYRISLAGYENHYLPFPIVHYKGESTKKDSYRYVKVFYEAMVIFFRKHYPHYGLFFAFMVKSGIYVRALFSLIYRWLKRLRPTPPEPKVCLLVIGNEKTFDEVRQLCVTNQLDGTHHYVTVKEPFCLDNLSELKLPLEEYTHVVFDRELFTFTQVIRLMGSSSVPTIELGLYSRQTKTMVTPLKTYQ